MSVVKPFTISTDTFKPDLFKGKVLFCTGGESGQHSKRHKLMLDTKAGAGSATTSLRQS